MIVSEARKRERSDKASGVPRVGGTVLYGRKPVGKYFFINVLYILEL